MAKVNKAFKVEGISHMISIILVFALFVLISGCSKDQDNQHQTNLDSGNQDTVVPHGGSDDPSTGENHQNTME